MASIDYISSAHACRPPFGMLEGIISLVVNIGRTRERMHLALKVAKKDSLIRRVYAGGSRFPQSLSPAISVRRGERDGKQKRNSWWMESVGWDSGLAPTLEVFFELRVSEHRKVGLCAFWGWNGGEDKIMVMVSGWIRDMGEPGGGELNKWWHLITHPASNGLYCICFKG